MNNKTTQKISYIAIAVALCIIFKLFPLWKMPLGGEISLEMLPIFIIGFLFNYKLAIITGIIASFISFLMQPIIIHPLQIILDYPLAYGLVGFSTIIYKKDKFFSIIYTIIFATFLRFSAHFISGILFFKTYIPKNFYTNNIYIYSAIYNASYLIPESIITIITILLIYKKLNLRRF